MITRGPLYDLATGAERRIVLPAGDGGVRVGGQPRAHAAPSRLGLGFDRTGAPSSGSIWPVAR